MFTKLLLLFVLATNMLATHQKDGLPSNQTPIEIEIHDNQNTGPGYYLVNTFFIGEVHALHINWGWQGECNGYFNFNTYNTNNAVSYDEGNGSTYNFSSNLEMIANIY